MTLTVLEFADGSFVVESVVSGYWRAYKAAGDPIRLPDRDRPGKSGVALYPSPELATAALRGLGFATEAR